MKLAHLSAPITRPETLWQWLCLLTLVCLGWISREQLGVMFAEIETETDNGALLVYDHDGNGHVFLPDDVAGATAFLSDPRYGFASAMGRGSRLRNTFGAGYFFDEALLLRCTGRVVALLVFAQADWCGAAVSQTLPSFNPSS